jgi:hypothetical protein
LYTPFLVLHSYLRWVVLLAALVVVARAAAGMAFRRPWGRADEATTRVFMASLDTQLLVGLVLYFFLSPFTALAWSDLGSTMRDAPLRFIMIEHQFGMLVAVILAHAGHSRMKKMSDARRRHTMALVFFGLALLIMLASIPWPGMPAGRPLLRGFTDVSP